MSQYYQFLRPYTKTKLLIKIKQAFNIQIFCLTRDTRSYACDKISRVTWTSSVWKKKNERLSFERLCLVIAFNEQWIKPTWSLHPGKKGDAGDIKTGFAEKSYLRDYYLNKYYFYQWSEAEKKNFFQLI